jgi:hypothetical protein
MGDRTPGLAETLAALAGTAMMVWATMPPQQRFWIRQAALSRCHRHLARLARRQGYRAMGDELAGRDYRRYDLTILLAAARDRLAAELEGMRP